MVATIPVGNGPIVSAIDTSKNLIYVTNVSDDTVSVIDGTTNTVIATVPVGDRPIGAGVLTTTS